MLRVAAKRCGIKYITVREKLDLVILQEVKKSEAPRSLIANLWGSRFKNWCLLPTVSH